MMRITNSMMTSNTKNNINLNKVNADDLNTQMATGQKISRPSDDPVIAIRALRLNTNLSQLNQYYDKNIPDAEAWLKVTETALSQTNAIFDSIKENLTTGASDHNTPTDRQKLLQNLKGLRTEVYAAGNADYAGRTVFTGYRTSESLTFINTDEDLNCNYKIYQDLTADSVEKISYINSDDSEYNIDSHEVYRIRLPYDTIKNESGTLTISAFDKYGKELTASKIECEYKSIAGMTQAQIDEVYTDGKSYVIPETGEIILSKEDAEKMQNLPVGGYAKTTYNKSSWQPGELRPEHYFACDKTETNGNVVNYNYNDIKVYDLDGSGNPQLDTATGEYKMKTINGPYFVDQELEVEISFNQKIKINTNADAVYTHDIARDMDDLLKVTQDVVDLDEKIAKLKKELAAESDATKKEDIQKKLDAANKEYSFKKDKMQKAFSQGIDKFEKYADRNNTVVAEVGNLSLRLGITKDRVSDQLMSFKELADDNINISITDTAIDLSNATLALQAAQLSASKIAQQTLLNYL